MRDWPEWKHLFILALTESPNVTDAARFAGIARPYAYEARGLDPSFREAWDDAMQVSVDRLEAAAFRRATDGVEKPIFWRGRKCGSVREYSDSLVSTLLRAHRPEKYHPDVQITNSATASAAASPIVASPTADVARKALADLQELGIVRAVAAELGEKPKDE